MHDWLVFADQLNYQAVSVCEKIDKNNKYPRPFGDYI